MAKKHAETAILEGSTIQAPVAEGAELSQVKPQDGQQQTAAAATELSPIERYRAAQRALEDTQKHLQELRQTLTTHQQRRAECEQSHRELVAAERLVQARILVAQEAVVSARADVLLVKNGTPEARAAAGRVATAEQRVEEAKAAAEQAKAAIEAALTDASQSTRAEMELAAKIAELQPLIPHLEERIREAHKAMGQAIARDKDGRIARAERVREAAQKQLADAEAALLREQQEADAALVPYPEVRATRTSAVPVPASPFEDLLQQQSQQLERIAASVTRIRAENLPAMANNNPYWYAFVITPNMVASAFQSRDPGLIKPALQMIREYQDILKGYRNRGWIN